MNVLHIVSSLNVGGTQTLLKQLMSNDIYKEGVRAFFLVENECKGYFDSDIEKFGGVIIRGPSPSKNIFKYSFFLANVFIKNKIDLVHSHVSLFSGYISFVAFLFGVNKRICHSHRVVKKSKGLYYQVMTLLIYLFSTKKIACSTIAGESLFSNASFEVIENGMDFYSVLSKKKTSINNDKIKIGHVGRFVEEKNHEFLINLVEKNIKEFELHLVGDGPLFENIKLLTEKLNISHAVTFYGNQKTPFDCLSNCDVVVFPSFSEGFGIAVVESQINGFPTIISDAIPDSTKIIHSLVKKVPLNNCVNIWSQSIRDFSKIPKVNIEERFKLFKSSPFNLDVIAKKYREDIYELCEK